MKFAIVQVRGLIGVNKKVKDTLNFLNLHKKNSCVVIDPLENVKGMVLKAKDYITWGEIDKETFKELLIKRGKLVGNKLLNENYLKEKLKVSTDEFVKDFFSGNRKLKDVPGLKPYFRLHPPRKGYEKGGIKKPFSMGGVLGYRKEYINDLVKRMI